MQRCRRSRAIASLEESGHVGGGIQAVPESAIGVTERGRVISSRIVRRPWVSWKVPWVSTTWATVGVVGILQQVVERSKVIVRNGREEMMGDMHVLAIDEHGPSRERIGEEHARVRQPAGVGVRMLVDIPQEHEIHE